MQNIFPGHQVPNLRQYFKVFILLVIIFSVQFGITRSGTNKYKESLSERKILQTQLQLTLQQAERLSTDAFEFNLKREVLNEQLGHTQQALSEKNDQKLRYPLLRSPLLYFRSRVTNAKYETTHKQFNSMLQSFQECQEKLDPVLSYSQPESIGLPDWEETDKYYFDWTGKSLAFLYAQPNTGQIYEDARDKIRSVEYLLKQPRLQEQVPRATLEQLFIESSDAQKYAWQYCLEVITQHNQESREALTSSIKAHESWENRIRLR